MTSGLAAGGLVFDMFGAFALALAFMAKRPARIGRESSTYVGYNRALAESMASQTADARVGLVLLVAGFAAQLAGNLGFSPDWASWKVMIPVAIYVGTVALLALFTTLRPLMVQRVIGELNAHFSK